MTQSTYSSWDTDVESHVAPAVCILDSPCWTNSTRKCSVHRTCVHIASWSHSPWSPCILGTLNAHFRVQTCVSRSLWDVTHRLTFLLGENKLGFGSVFALLFFFFVLTSNVLTILFFLLDAGRPIKLAVWGELFIFLEPGDAFDLSDIFSQPSEQQLLRQLVLIFLSPRLPVPPRSRSPPHKRQVRCQPRPTSGNKAKLRSHSSRIYNGSHYYWKRIIFIWACAIYSVRPI